MKLVCSESASVALHKVGEGSAGVGLNAGHLIVNANDDAGEHVSSVGLLELLGHVIGDLANSVEGSVSNLGIRVLAVLSDHWDHHLDLLGLVDVLTNLGESHDAGVLVAPVTVV